MAPPAQPIATLYGLTRCSSCRKARQWLEQAGIAHRFVDYRDEPIEPALLKAWAAELGWPRLVNRASMTWRRLPEARKTPAGDDDWLGLIAEFPALVRRPVTVVEGAVVTGFSPNRYAALFAA